MKKIDILMATHNGGQYLIDQIESILWQDFTEWNLLISDDCSNDNTLAIIDHYAQVDNRIKIISKDIHFGSAKHNFINMLKFIESDYAMFCDQDDVWLPDKLLKSYQCITDLENTSGNDKALLVYSDMMVVNQELSIISYSFQEYEHIDSSRIKFKEVLAQSIGAGCTFIFNRCLVDLALRNYPIDDVIMHDWWISLIAAEFGEITFIREPLSLYRQHESNAIGAKKFSLKYWLLNMTEMVERQRNISIQAGCFADTYSTLMPSKDVKTARACASIIRGNPVSNLRLLLKCGAWKRGIKKLGQVVACVDIGINNILESKLV